MQDLLDKITAVAARAEALEQQLADPAVAANPSEYGRIAKELAALRPASTAASAYARTLREIEETRVLLEGEEAELRVLAEAEIETLTRTREDLEQEIRMLLLPRDPNDAKNAILEVRAGTGGDEASLFALDLFRMYQRFAEKNGWRVELLSTSESPAGGLKEGIVCLRGEQVFQRLKYERGVHRVQRVPTTESQGRIHTSTVTVAVLPEAEEVDVQIGPSDLRIDVYRASGPGGQSVNTTDSAVRITHIPTGTVVQCQDEKSQHKNKAKAMKVLRSRLLDRMIAEREAERARERKTQVGTGDRSAKIRTYNFLQGRVTDHRIGLTLHQLGDVLDGALDELIGSLRLAEEQERLGADDE